MKQARLCLNCKSFIKPTHPEWQSGGCRNPGKQVRGYSIVISPYNRCDNHEYVWGEGLRLVHSR